MSAEPRSFARPLLLRKLSSWLPLLALIAASIALRAWAARETPGPWISPDEMIYGLLGRGLYQTGHLAILGGPSPYYSFLVPAFAGLPLSLGDFDFGYGLLKVLQAVAMSLAALPVYLWARSLVSRGWALTAAALTLAVPGLAYSGLVMSEVLFYPLLTLVAWAMASALARPTARAQALVVLATVVLAATRLQAIVLLPAFATALALDAALARSANTLRRLWPALGALSVIAAGWVGWRLAVDRPLLAGYAAVTHASYDVGRAATFVTYHAASLLILAGLFPVLAVALLLVEGLVRGERSREARAYLAVSAALAFWLVLEVGVFASEQVDRLAERDLLGLAPILFVGFVLWLERGGPRSFVVASAVGLAAAALLLTLPLDRMVTVFAAQDAFTLIPLLRLREAASLNALQIVFSIGVAVAIIAFVVLPRRLLTLLPAVVLAGFIAASVSATLYVRDGAAEQRANLLGSNPRWVDRAAAGPVAYVYGGEPDWDAVWHMLFWNHKIRWIYDLPDAELPGPVPQRTMLVAPSGRLVETNGGVTGARYGVTSNAYALVGTPVAQIAQSGIRQSGLRLWHIDPPLRLSTHVSGLRPNGDIQAAGDAKLLAYGCKPGSHFLVTIIVKTQTTIELLRNGSLYRRLVYPSLRPNALWHGRIPTVEGRGVDSGTCALDIRSSGLIGTTVFDIERA